MFNSAVFIVLKAINVASYEQYLAVRREKGESGSFSKIKKQCIFPKDVKVRHFNFIFVAIMCYSLFFVKLYTLCELKIEGLLTLFQKSSHSSE